MRLRAMERDGQLVFNKFKQYELAKERLVLTGKVIGHRDGYGFFVNEQGGKDLFISSYEMQRVIHGDIVEAIVDNKSDRKGRKEVRILNVIEPRKAPIVGRIFIDKKQAIVKPEDARIQQEIIIPLTEKSTARHGQIVAVELLERPSKRRNAIGKVVEVLGDHQAPGMEIQIALREHDLPHVWPEAVLEEANQWAEQVPEEAFKDRIDLRHLPLVTIDGEDARGKQPLEASL